jgi:PleD family two-component response regulator
MAGIRGVARGTNPELGEAGDEDPMLTHTAAPESLRQAVLPGTTTQKVVIVNGNAEILEMLDTVLEAGHYDVVFVESSQHAYSQIKRVQPNLVILCVRIDDAEGFQVLSMLKLDAGTRDIPVLTYTTEDTEESEEEVAEPSESEMFTGSKAAVWMN